MSDFITTSEAYRIARERASVATALEANLLHVAVFDAREAGMSVREAATALNTPKSTVARHWRENHRCPDVLPLWGSERAWRDAHAAVWAHDPEELADGWVPYEWEAQGAFRAVRARSRGVVELGQWPTGERGKYGGDEERS